MNKTIATLDRTLTIITAVAAGLLCIMLGFALGAALPDEGGIPDPIRIVVQDEPRVTSQDEADAFDRGFAAGVEHEAWFCQNTDPKLDGRLEDVPQSPKSR